MLAFLKKQDVPREGEVGYKGTVVPLIKPLSAYRSDVNGKIILPEGISFINRLRTHKHEVLLRLRLAKTGFTRGLFRASGVFGVGRLYATHYKCMCGDPTSHGTYSDHGVIKPKNCPMAEITHLGLLSTKVITDAGVGFLVDDWDNSAVDITNMNFHGCGTGTASESTADTGLGTESTTALNPDNTRATGTKSQPAANQLRSIGTLTFDASAAVTEHGLFSASGTGSGVLWDRSVFSAINVANGDSIQFTYTCTVASGG